MVRKIWIGIVVFTFWWQAAIDLVRVQGHYVPNSQPTDGTVWTMFVLGAIGVYLLTED